jgi:prevent-host-death family protein
MSQFNIHIAKAQLSELIQKAMLGEEVIIARDNQPLVKLTPLKIQKQSRKIGLAKGLITIASDFNEPLEDFEDYYK